MVDRPYPPRDYYEILGVPPTADRQQIESAYRGLARQHHPDARPQGTGSDAEFKRVTEAYETLSDSQRRRQYDRRRARPSRPTDAFTSGESTRAAPAGFGSLGSMFSQKQPYGGPSGGGDRRRRDVEAELPLSPEEARRGGLCEFTISFADACPQCRAAQSRSCGICGGNGRLIGRSRLQIQLPAGLVSGEILCIPGKGKPARGDEPAGDLRLRICVRPCW